MEPLSTKEGYADKYNRYIATPYEELDFENDDDLKEILRYGKHFWLDKCQYEVDKDNYIELFNKCIILGRKEYLTPLYSIIKAQDSEYEFMDSKFDCIKYCYLRADNNVYKEMAIGMLKNISDPYDRLDSFHDDNTNLIQNMLELNNSLTHYVFEELLDSEESHSNVLSVVNTEPKSKDDALFKAVINSVVMLIAYFENIAGEAKVLVPLTRTFVFIPVDNFQEYFMEKLFKNIAKVNHPSYLLTVAEQSPQFLNYITNMKIDNIELSIDMKVVLKSWRNDITFPKKIAIHTKGKKKISLVTEKPATSIDLTEGPIFNAVMTLLEDPDANINTRIFNRKKIELRLISPFRARSLFLNDYTADVNSQIFVKVSGMNRQITVGEYLQDMSPTPLEQIRIIDWTPKHKDKSMNTKRR